jgi:hypothetical protein
VRKLDVSFGVITGVGCDKSTLTGVYIPVSGSRTT